MLNVVNWNLIRNGDENAFEEVYDTYAGKIYQYGRYFTQDQQLVDDCVQELFTELWDRRKHLGATTSIQYYLLRSIRRKIVHKLKLEDKRKVKENIYIYLQASESPEGNNSINPEEKEALLVRAINLLPDRQREIIYLRYFQGLSFDNIADMMMLTKKTAYNITFIALGSLRKKLKPYSFTDN